MIFSEFKELRNHYHNPKLGHIHYPKKSLLAYVRNPCSNPQTRVITSLLSYSIDRPLWTVYKGRIILFFLI